MGSATNVIGRSSQRKPLRIVGITLLSIAVALAAFAFLAAETRVASKAVPTVGDSASNEDRGAAAFVGAGFGGLSLEALETNAIPWKLTAAALVLDAQLRDPSAPADHATLRKELRRFGFLYPHFVEGVPESFALQFDTKPLGMAHGTIAPIGGASVEVANLSCASCHAGVAYGPDGEPDPATAAIGMPNTSLDLEAYTQAIFIALRRHVDDPKLLDTVGILFPEMRWNERLSLKWIVLPLARQRLSELEGQDRPLSFPNGLPGATNGVAALKHQLGTPLLGGGAQDRGFVSIPELALRNRRNRLLTDGAYAVPSGAPDTASLAAITSFFTVPSMGVHPDEARSHQDEAEAIFAWLAQYKPLPFPGPVDQDTARAGHAIYEAGCASCHGSFEWDQGRTPALANFPNWVGDVGTDPLRSMAFDRSLADAVAQTGYADLIDVRVGEGYAAPPLAGLWASPPFLHNGSVQSLAALLDPAQRLSRFQIGGHALDWQSMGVRLRGNGSYPADYAPFAIPQWIDTTQPGMGNQGHEFGSTLTAEERAALIEFLKLL